MASSAPTRRAVLALSVCSALLRPLPCVAQGAALDTRAACRPNAPRPRVHIYALPERYQKPPNTWRLANVFGQRLRRSPFYEPNPACAEYFYINHFAGADQPKAERMFAYIATRWPYLNESITRNVATHIVYLPCDHGPGDCMFWKPLRGANPRLDRLRINPASRSRLTIFLVLNGMDDRHGPGAAMRCRSCFLPGVDIRLPTPHRHLCGPLCGYSLDELRAKSPWALPRRAGDELLRQPRPVKFFWAGKHKGRNQARAQLVRHFGGARHPGFRVLNLEPPRLQAGKPPPPKPPRPVTSTEMLQADFCGSPPGWDDGDSDRYLPAVLFGCIPVFFSKHESRPLEELPEMQWANVSVRVDVGQIARLHTILEAIPTARVVQMRLAMRSAWQRLLFSSYPMASVRGGKKDWKVLGSGASAKYLDEDGQHDAFDGVIAILRRRLEQRASTTPRAPATPDDQPSGAGPPWPHSARDLAGPSDMEGAGLVHPHRWQRRRRLWARRSRTSQQAPLRAYGQRSAVAYGIAGGDDKFAR